MATFADGKWQWRFLAVAGLGVVACRGSGSAGTASEAESGEATGEDSGDGETGDTGPGAAPPTPELSTPVDGATEVAVQTELCWKPVQDPDGDRVRYRVFVDDIELTQGNESEAGFAGPCAGPLDLAHDREYAWRVLAFDADAPESQSASSETWRFRTVWDGESKVLFEDTFEQDSGWEIGGEAAGAWVWGAPEFTEHEPSQLVTELSQPGGCVQGSKCMFTGHNPEGVASEQDVAGGSTILTSPAFDLSGTQSVTVSLSRFFYKSAVEETGSWLRVELLVPDADEPDGVLPFVLEHLELGEAIEDSNAWDAITLPACGVPAVAGARLRITASDVGDEIVEAAIDAVEVRGFQNADLCGDGLDALCDPDDAQPCVDGLLCCPQGVLQTGFFRCREPVAGLDFADPPADPDDPNNGPLGCDAPDLSVTEPGMETWIEDVFIQPNGCALLEGCVGDSGWRKLLRFDAQTPNLGSTDLVMGIPANHPDLYHYSPCHMHFHFDGYAAYTLLDGNQEIMGGHKQAFCMVDWRSWAWPWLEGKEVDGTDGNFNCYNQGLSRGWEDVYNGGLECQWIDITDLAPGDYTLRIEVNPVLPASDHRLLVERDYGNNVLEVPVQIP